MSTPSPLSLQNKSQEVKRVLVLGERLVAANHYAAEEIKVKSAEVKGQWEGLMTLVDEREALLTLTISFFDRQQKVSSEHTTCTAYRGGGVIFVPQHFCSLPCPGLTICCIIFVVA